jgi:hypothetical protein
MSASVSPPLARLWVRTRKDWKGPHEVASLPWYERLTIVLTPLLTLCQYHDEKSEERMERDKTDVTLEMRFSGGFT